MQNSHVILIIVMAMHCLVCGSRMQEHCGLICAAGALPCIGVGLGPRLRSNIQLTPLCGISEMAGMDRRFSRAVFQLQLRHSSEAVR